MPSRNDDDDTNPQHQQKQRVASSQKQRSTDNFVFGRSSSNQNNNQQNQRYTTANFPNVNDTNLDTNLLKHLSDDFAQLLNRTDISDCLLNVKGKLNSLKLLLFNGYCFFDRYLYGCSSMCSCRSFKYFCW